MKTQNLKISNLKISSIKQRGSVILEGMIAILIFSIGILAVVGLQGVSIKNVAGAKHRADASLLANQIIGQMWLADKTTASLQTNFNSPAGAKYLIWTSSVQLALPGVVSAVGLTTFPIITIDGNNEAIITIKWQSPGETVPNQHITRARING